MDYKYHYNLLIEKAKTRGKIKEGYFERHHILPKARGGNDRKENRVCLTAREHFVAHILLAKIYGGGMWQAAIMMKQSPKWVDRYVNSKLYENAKIEWANYLRGEKRSPEIMEPLRQSNIGRKWTLEQRAARSEMQKGRIRPGNPDSFKHTDASRKKMSESHITAKSYLRLPLLSGDKNHMKLPEHRLRQSLIKTEYWKKKREEQEIAKTGLKKPLDNEEKEV